MLKNYFYNGLSIILATIAATLVSVILARVLGPEKWGVYSQVNWLIGVTATLFGGGLAFTAMRFLSTDLLAEDSTERSRIIVWLTLVRLLLILPGCLLLFFFAPQINDALGWHLEPRLIQVAALGLMGFLPTSLGMAMLRGLRRFRALALVSVPASLATLATIPIVLRYQSVEMLIAVTAIGQLFLIPLFIFLIGNSPAERSRIAFPRVPVMWRIMMRYSVLVYLTAIVDQIVWQHSEIFFLGQLSDPAQVGYYSLAYTFPSIVFAVTAVAITSTLTPIYSSSTDVSGRQHGDLSQLYRQSFSLLNWIVFPSAIGLAIVSPTAILIFYGEAYISVIPIIYLVILSSMMGALSRPSASVLLAINRPSVLLIITLLVLPLNLGLAWYLVPRHGAIGAAMANLAAQSAGATMTIIYATRAARLRYDWSTIGMNMVGAAACGASAWLAISFIRMPILALLIAIAIGGIVYFIVGIALKNDTTLMIKSLAQSKVSQFQVITEPK